MKTPIITLWQPWASWIAKGWKTIETREHRRFKSLRGFTIGIHAGKRWDYDALKTARPYLTDEQFLASREGYEIWRVSGEIICTAYVEDFRLLKIEDSQAALIDCDRDKTPRWGLILRDIKPLARPIRMSGGRGIWYWEI